MRTHLVISGIAQAALLAFGAAPQAMASPIKPRAKVVRTTAPVASVKVAKATATLAAKPTAKIASKGDPVTPLVEDALAALAGRVTKTSHPDALRMAFQAYYSYKASNPGQVRNPYFYFVDYGLDKRTPRGYVFDMDQKRVIEGPFIVAAGKGSAENARGVPTRFSNGNGSGSTSLGLYVTRNTYSFTGHASGRTYKSIGLRLNGVSGKFNDKALSRGVVVHGAPYVTPTGSGRSQGCPAMEQTRAQRLIPKLANGGLVFLFSPNDVNWMRSDPWGNA